MLLNIVTCYFVISCLSFAIKGIVYKRFSKLYFSKKCLICHFLHLKFCAEFWHSLCNSSSTRTPHSPSQLKCLLFWPRILSNFFPLVFAKNFIRATYFQDSVNMAIYWKIFISTLCWTLFTVCPFKIWEKSFVFKVSSESSHLRNFQILVSIFVKSILTI